jgi:Chromo (CHRromatin Organisation MOdifier) domain
VKRVGSQAYELALPTRWRIHDVFSVSNLESYRLDGSMQPPPPPELLKGEEEYELELESIVNRHVSSTGRPKYEYLVGWKGYSVGNGTWEDERNLTNAPAIVKGYWD